MRWNLRRSNSGSYRETRSSTLTTNIPVIVEYNRRQPPLAAASSHRRSSATAACEWRCPAPSVRRCRGSCRQCDNVARLAPPVAGSAVAAPLRRCLDRLCRRCRCRRPSSSPVPRPFDRRWRSALSTLRCRRVRSLTATAHNCAYGEPPGCRPAPQGPATALRRQTGYGAVWAPKPSVVDCEPRIFEELPPPSPLPRDRSLTRSRSRWQRTRCHRCSCETDGRTKPNWNGLADMPLRQVHCLVDQAVLPGYDRPPSRRHPEHHRRGPKAGSHCELHNDFVSLCSRSTQHIHRLLRQRQHIMWWV